MFLFDILSSKYENTFMIHISIKVRENACLQCLHQQSESLLLQFSFSVLISWQFGLFNYLIILIYHNLLHYFHFSQYTIK